MLESTEKTEINQIPKAEESLSKPYHFLGTRTERIVFLILMTLISTGPIIFGKSIPSHADWHIHIEHAYNFKRCFWQGQLLPRWIDAQVNGYGEPIFNFYAPLVYYLFTFLELIFKNPIVSIKWAFVIPMILCTVFGYLYLRKHASPISSSIAMAFVIFSPAIHIFIYNTNWPTSTLGLAFLFLTLYGMERFNKDVNFDLKSFLITSFSYACMALAHLATAFIFTLISVPYFLFNIYVFRTRRYFKFYLASIVMGAALAGFYLFPASYEKNLVHTDEVLTAAPLWDYSKNFLFTYLDRHRDDGYAWAIFDHRYYEVSNALFCLAVLLAMVILILNKDKFDKYFSNSHRISISLFMFTACFVMMTPISLFVWLMIKPMQTIQFPWRFTAFILPFGASIIAYAVDIVGKLAKDKINVSGYKLTFYLIGCIFCCLLYVDFINMYRWAWMPEQSLIKAGMNVLWANEEYRPNLTGDPNWKQVNYRQDFSSTVESSSALTDTTILKWTSHERIVEVFSPEEHQIRLRIFYFPGWTVYIDDRKVDISMDPKAGSMIFRVSPGKHQIRIAFELTPVRRISAYASLAALFIYLFLFVKEIQKKKFKFENIAKRNEIKNIPVEVTTT